MDTFSEVKVAVLGFFLNIRRTFGEHSENIRRKNSQLLYLLGFAAGKNVSSYFSAFQSLIVRYLNGPSGVAVTLCAAKGSRLVRGSSLGIRHQAGPGAGNWSRRGTALDQGVRGVT